MSVKPSCSKHGDHMDIRCAECHTYAPAAAVPEAEDGREALVPDAAVEAAHATWTTSNAFGMAMWRECLEAAAPFILAAVPARDDERERLAVDFVPALMEWRASLAWDSTRAGWYYTTTQDWTRLDDALHAVLAAALPEGQEG